MPLDRAKVLRFQQFYSESPELSGQQFDFLRGICWIQLGEFPAAQRMFSSSICGLLRDGFWWRSTQPNWLVDVCALSGRSDLYSAVATAMHNYRSRPDRRLWGLTDRYAYAIAELLMGKTDTLPMEIQPLLNKPAVKDHFAMAKALLAISERDTVSYQLGLRDLLKAHEGIAKYGSLRYTAEGLLCMSAMALALIADRQGMRAEIVNDYFSQTYLDYLLGLDKARTVQ